MICVVYSGRYQEGVGNRDEEGFREDFLEEVTPELRNGAEHSPNKAKG